MVEGEPALESRFFEKVDVKRIAIKRGDFSRKPQKQVNEAP